MSLTVLVAPIEPIMVRPNPSKDRPWTIDLGGEASVYLNEEQRTKLCFDLLATIDPMDMPISMTSSTESIEIIR